MVARRLKLLIKKDGSKETEAANKEAMVVRRLKLLIKRQEW